MHVRATSREQAGVDFTDGFNPCEAWTMNSSDPGFKILNSLSIPVVRCDRNSSVTYINQSARQVFGQDITGTDLSLFLSLDIPGADLSFKELLKSVIAQFPNEVGHVALVLTRSDGYRREIISRMTYDPSSDQVSCVLLP